MSTAIAGGTMPEGMDDLLLKDGEDPKSVPW